MIIYVNGCSHSIGISKYSWSYALGNSICRDFNYKPNKGIDEIDSVDYNPNQNSVYNFSDSGKGNDMIFYETIEFISKCKLNNIKPDYIFIQWSGPSRIAKQLYDGSIQLYTPADNDVTLLNFEPFASRTTISYIYSLQELLKKENIEYSFCCYMELDMDITQYSVYHNIDLDRFISFDNTTHPIFDGFRNKMRINGFVIDGAGHPNYYGHWFLCNKFLEKININNLDVGFFELILPLIGDGSYPNFETKYHSYITSFYDDFMVNKNTVKALSLKEVLKEGSQTEKNDIRKSLL